MTPPVPATLPAWVLAALDDPSGFTSWLAEQAVVEPDALGPDALEPVVWMVHHDPGALPSALTDPRVASTSATLAVAHGVIDVFAGPRIVAEACFEGFTVGVRAVALASAGASPVTSPSTTVSALTALLAIDPAVDFPSASGLPTATSRLAAVLTGMADPETVARLVAAGVPPFAARTIAA